MKKEDARGSKDSQSSDSRQGDSDVASLAERALRTDGNPNLIHVKCSYREGKLTLRGTLSTHRDKRIALSIVGRVEGVREIDDQIEMEWW